MLEANGEAQYIADRHYDGLLEGRFYRSTCSRGYIKAVNVPELPDGYYLFSAKDVPGTNRLPIVVPDWPAFADTEVRYIGQVILLLVGPDPLVLEQLLTQVSVEYEPLTPAYTVAQSKALVDGAIHNQDNLFDAHQIDKGDIEAGFAQAVTIFEETVTTGYQEHLYLETQGCVGYVADSKVVIEGSMQCPWYVYHCMSTVLGHQHIRVIQAPTGGGFGGKEDYPNIIAGPLAVAVNQLRQPIRVVLERREDIAFTSKRHPVEFHYRTGVDKHGQIVAMDIKFDLNSGAYFSLSGIVLQRAITTATNVYDIANVRIQGQAWCTNTVPTGAFRGFGSPQTCFCIESHMNHIAQQLGQAPLAFKQAHLLTNQSTTLTGASIFGELVITDLIEQSVSASQYLAKRAAYAAQSSQGAYRKGIGISIFQHGCGFAGDLEDTLVKAKVRLIKDQNEQVTILVSNTDIGQGLVLTFRQIVADTLALPLSQVDISVVDTDSVPDSGPTVASRSIVIVGYILEQAALALKQQWQVGEYQEIEQDYQKPSYHQWDQINYQGNAYQSTSYGVNVVEVEVDMASYEVKINDAWGCYDIGHVINEQIFNGQIDGGMVQALGYGAMEKLELNGEGVFAQKSMADYMVPTSLDVPRIQRSLVDNPYPYGPQGAKGGGELTHNGAASAFVAAVEQAVGQAFNRIPVTPEVIAQTLTNEPQANIKRIDVAEVTNEN